MSSIYRIADLTLDTGRRQLLRNGQPVPLGPLTYKLFLALVDKSPELATHDYIAEFVWSRRPVSPETVKQRIKLLRDALGDDAETPKYVELVRGQGYRLRLPVAVVPAGPARRPWWKIATAVSAVIVIAVAAAVYFRFPQPWGVEPRTTTSIAVLPFADMSPGQDHSYFAEGISEEIRNLLARTTDLRVIARTSSFSFKNRPADIVTIGETLNVDHVLEGSVRKSGNRVRITAQLVDTTTSTQLWSASYDRKLGDILTLQDEIAASVAAALKVTLSDSGEGQPLVARSVKPDAFDAYLRGLHELREFSYISLPRAERLFEQSIRHDPEFVRAYYALGMTYTTQVIAALVPESDNRPKLRDIIRRGLALAPDHAGLIALSGQLARFDGDLDAAERQLQRAIVLAPSDIWVRTLYAGFYMDRSHPREALKTAQRTLEIDPLNPSPYTTLGFSNIDMGDADAALAAASHFVQILPSNIGHGLSMSGFIRVFMQGDFVGGIRDWEAASHSEAWDHEGMNLLAVAYYTIGDLKRGDAWLDKAMQKAPGMTMTRAVQAYRLVLGGEHARATETAIDAAANPDQFTRWWGGTLALRLATDALIERGEARRAVELMLEIAPEWAAYRNRADIAPQDFSPAPYQVKSSYTSYPALYFADLIRASKAAGDEREADNMLRHLEAIIQWRQERGLLVEGLHVAEALALRGRPEAALDALEEAEQSGTIYNFWQLRLLHNGVFEDIRDHPRFEALVGRVEAEMDRQRSMLAASHPLG